MNERAHPAASLEPTLSTARSRAKLAVAALGASALLRVYATAVTLWQNSLLTETKLARARSFARSRWMRCERVTR